MGFFLDGENAQMPVVMGVLRTRKGEQSTDKQFLFTGQDVPDGIAPNAAKMPTGSTNTISPTNSDPVDNNSVSLPNNGVTPGSAGSPANLGNAPGVSGSSMNSQKPTTPSKPIPAASGTGGPWKMLEYKLTYLVEDLASSAGTLIRSDDGNFIDVIENKVVSADKLLGKIKNFLGAVFAQLISALRQELDALAQAIQLPAETIASFLGIPGATFTAIETAISTILSAICALDGNLSGYIDSAIGSLLGVVEGIVGGLISQAEAALQGVQSMIDSIICTVQDILGQVMGVVDTVKGIVELGEQAKEIIDAWQSGSQYFFCWNGCIDKMVLVVLLVF